MLAPTSARDVTRLQPVLRHCCVWHVVLPCERLSKKPVAKMLSVDEIRSQIRACSLGLGSVQRLEVPG